MNSLCRRLWPAFLVMGLTLVPDFASARVELGNNAGPLGIYALSTGSRLWVGPMVDENGTTSQYVFANGRVGRALWRHTGKFESDGSCPVTLIRNTDNSIAVSDCHGTGTARLIATPRARDMTFIASDGRTIGASFWSLPGKGRPAIVLCHGADYETREMGAIVPILLDWGLNVLSFDQRGSGASQGDWKPDGIVQVASDAALAAHLLRQRGLARTVGFYGFSNGGWVAPAAAARSGGKTFVIVKSADGQSVAKNIAYETLTAVRAKFGAEAGRTAAATIRIVLHAVETDAPADWARAKQALASTEKAPWRSLTSLPSVAGIPLPAAVVAGYRRQTIYDPADDWRSIQGPVLIMLGAQDKEVEATSSVARLRKLFASANKRDVTIRVYHGAGHQLVMGPGAAADSSMSAGVYARAFLPDLHEWISRNLLRRTAVRGRSGR